MAMGRESSGPTQQTGDQSSVDSDPQTSSNHTHGPAADRVVRDLLNRLNVPIAGVASHHAQELTTTDSAADSAKKVDDSEVEALNPKELAAFEAAVKAVVDPTLLAAIKSAPGGMIGFLETIADGGKVGDIDEAAFVTMWNNSADEAWLKDRFRAVMPGDHEWIPSNQIEEVTAKAKGTAEKASDWVDLQNELRSPTPTVIFNEAHSKQDATNTYLQAHVGALYVEENGKPVMQTVREAEFHDALRAAFTSAKTIPQAIDMLQAVMVEWMWKGEALSKPLVPGLMDSVNKPIDEATLTSERAATYGAILQKFTDIRTKFAGK
jgi:hypothetical protein